MKFLILAVAMVFSLGSLAIAADTKVAYVDMQKALEQTKAGQKADKQLKESLEKRKKTLKSKEDDFAKLREDFDKKALVLSEEVKGKKQRELQENFQALQQLAMKNEQELGQEQKKLLEPIFKKLRDAVEKVSKKEGYSMVVEKREGGLVWATTDLDITDKVVKAFEE